MIFKILYSICTYIVDTIVVFEKSSLNCPSAWRNLNENTYLCFLVKNAFQRGGNAPFMYLLVTKIHVH